MIPAIPLITVRPIILKKCDKCGDIFSETIECEDFEPTPSPGFPNGSARRFLGSECCGATYHELEEP